MPADLLSDESLTERAKRLEHYETPEWAVRSILQREILTQKVIDPCCGTGIMGRIASEAGYTVIEADIHDWGHNPRYLCDWLTPNAELAGEVKDATVFYNPPFSEAVDFVKQAFALDARKVVAFQRMAWWESRDRQSFWHSYPPNRVYICGDRANCWRHDIAPDGRGSSSPTAHGWYVWERGNPAGTQLGHVWRGDAP